MSRMFLNIFCLLSFSVPYPAVADYVTPDEIVLLSPGIYARKSAVHVITSNQILNNVIKLYSKDIESMNNEKILVRGENNCIVLVIDTKNGIKNHIEQVIVEDAKCLGH